MKKIISLFLCACLLTCLFPGALAEGIEVATRDLSTNNALSRNVTNVLFLMQDGDVTDTIMIASIDSVSGRAVMTRVDCSLEVEVRDAGVHPIGEVYAMGAEGSKGRLTMRTINEWLGLNISTYLAMDMSRLPELVDQIGGTLNMQYDAAEAEALGGWEGVNGLTGDQVLAYVRLRLEGDAPARSRSYDALMQLLYQGLHSGDPIGLAMLGFSLLGSMDTNLSTFSVLPLVSAVMGGDDRRELALTAELTDGVEDSAQAYRDAFYREVYE